MCDARPLIASHPLSLVPLLSPSHSFSSSLQVLSLLRRCSPTDLNAVLLAPAFPSPEPTRDEGSLLLMHVLEGVQRTRTRALLLDLLARQRLADLSVAARAVLVRVLQEERRAFFSLSGLLMRAVADVLVGTTGHDLIRLKVRGW